MTTFTVQQVEAAINYHLAQEPSKDFKLVSKPARALANIYGLMCWTGDKKVDAAKLTTDQLQALTDIPASVKAEKE